MGGGDPRLRPAGDPFGPARCHRGDPPALRADRRRASVPGGVPAVRRCRHLPARALAGAARPVSRRRGPQVRLRGTRVRRPCRPAGQLPAVGEPDRRAVGVRRAGVRRQRPVRGQCVLRGPARAVRRRCARRTVRGDGRGGCRAAGRPRCPDRGADGYRVPVHRRGGQLRRDPARFPADGAGLRRHRPAGDLAGARHPRRPVTFRHHVRRAAGRAACPGTRPRAGVGGAGTVQPRPVADREQGPAPRPRPAGIRRRGRPA